MTKTLITRLSMLALLVLGLLALSGSVALASDQPVASFTISPTASFTGHKVTFDGSASHDPDGEKIASYQWSFGDGVTQTTTTASTTHAYAKQGAYTVTLTVLDTKGNSSAADKGTIQISADAPVASFTHTPRRPRAGHTVTFNGSASNDPDGDKITSYRWVFGDGATGTSSTPVATHVYAASGKYTVTLTVTDSLGNASAESIHTINVRGRYRVPKVRPTAAFTFAPPNPTTGQPVSFNASGSSDTDGDTISRYIWSFGDGATQTTLTPTTTHAYNFHGAFAVELVVVDSRGTRSKTTVHDISVGAVKPRLRRLHVHACTHRTRRCQGRGALVRFRLNEAGTVFIAIRRPGHRRLVVRQAVFASQGRNVVLIRFRGHRGVYVLRARPLGGHTVRARFHWR